MRHIPGGNGGFSLRNVKKFMEKTLQKKYLKLENIPVVKQNEDLIFSKYADFVYCKDFELHKAFSVETIYYENPVGIHKIYVWQTSENFDKIINHIINNIL